MIEEKCVSMLLRAGTLVMHSRKAQTTSSLKAARHIRLSVQGLFFCWTLQIQHLTC